MRMELQEEVNRELVIECENIYKSFDTPSGKREIIKNIDFRVRHNEFVVLLGPGQCGKTTMLNIIAGLEVADKGKVIVNSKTVTAPDPECGVVFQSISLFPWLTTMRNVEYGPKVRGVPRKERRKRAQHYINLVGLQGFENSYPIELSGGMKQRVGIARAYCNEPVVLLMDEPFSALDAQTRYLMQQELQKIWQTNKRTIVFVTNNIEEAVYLADRVVILSNCPAHVKEEITINLPRPRDYTSKEFLELRKNIEAISDMTK